MLYCSVSSVRGFERLNDENRFSETVLYHSL